MRERLPAGCFGGVDKLVGEFDYIIASLFYAAAETCLGSGVYDDVRFYPARHGNIQGFCLGNHNLQQPVRIVQSLFRLITLYFAKRSIVLIISLALEFRNDDKQNNRRATRRFVLVRNRKKVWRPSLQYPIYLVIYE